MLRIVSHLKKFYQTKGSPDQPRDDHGRWTSGGGSDTNSNAQNSDENVQGVESDSFDVAGGFEGVDKSQSVSDFVSANCIGSVRREIPGEFLDLSLGDFLKKKGAAAHKCYKLINEDRFRK